MDNTETNATVPDTQVSPEQEKTGNRIVIITELRFGSHKPELMDNLRDNIRSRKPDLLLVIGNITENVQKSQYLAASAFLRSLGRPWLAVPGDKDYMRWPPLLGRRNFAVNFHRFINTYTSPRVDAEFFRLAMIDSAGTHSRKNFQRYVADIAEARRYLTDSTATNKVRIAAASHWVLHDSAPSCYRTAHSVDLLHKDPNCPVDLMLWAQQKENEIGLFNIGGQRNIVKCALTKPCAPSGESLMQIDISKNRMEFVFWQRSQDTESFRQLQNQIFKRGADNSWQVDK